MRTSGTVAGGVRRTPGHGTGLRAVARVLHERQQEVVDQLMAVVLERMHELRDDDSATDRLRASIESNFVALLHLMESPVDEELIEAPAGAVQWALTLAQRGAPLTVLWRAYHLCGAEFFGICLRRLAEQGAPADELAAEVARLNVFLHAYIDHVVQRTGAAYEAERQRWRLQPDGNRVKLIAELLAGHSVPVSQAEAGLGYRMTGEHLGVIVWDPAGTGPDRLRLIQQALASYVDRFDSPQPPLLLPRDEASVWAWISVSPGATSDHVHALDAVLRRSPAMRAAVGEPRRGLPGFVQTHRHAAVAQAVALAAGDAAETVTPYREVANLGFLCADLDRAGEWVRDTLGPLAADDEPSARLRESLAAFLDTGGSHSAAADRLACHKNTVMYRIKRAEQQLGRPVRESRMDLELALHACRWLGSAVLTPTAP